jgi:phosphoesterase RecJ-like protein
MPTIKSLAEKIEKHQSFLLSVHVHPDGDCVGSIIAIERLLRKLGKKTQIVCESAVPATLDFLDKGSWKTVREIEGDCQAEASIAMDTPNWDRLGEAEPFLRKTKLINIDHHVSNQKFGEFNYLDSKASACGEIVFDLFKHFNIPLDKEVVRLLYVSISTDTGSFRYSNTTPKTHRVIAQLLADGLDVEKINQQIYCHYEDVRLSLMGLLIGNRRFEYNGQLCYSAISHDELIKAKGKSEDFEGAIDLMRGVNGVKACFLMTEWKKGILKVSFRSSSEVDVNQIATNLGGGGHRKAAGATLEGNLEAGAKKVVDLFKDSLRDQVSY